MDYLWTDHWLVTVRGQWRLFSSVQFKESREAEAKQKNVVIENTKIDVGNIYTLLDLQRLEPSQLDINNLFNVWLPLLDFSSLKFFQWIIQKTQNGLFSSLNSSCDWRGGGRTRQ